MSLVIQDFGGKHGADLAGTRARLLKGGSYKRQRIIVLLPAVAPPGKAVATLPAVVALSHWNLLFPPNNGVVRCLVDGAEVGEAYSKGLESILAHPELGKWEYLLTLEHDNLPPPDGVLKLLEVLEAHKDLAAVSGLYFCKGEGGCAQIWGDPQDPILNFRPQIPVADALIECCGIGMGFALWRLSMFKDPALVRPWFQTQKGPRGLGTQDLAFWTDARKFGYRCAVDCRVRVGHLDQESGVIW